MNCFLPGTLAERQTSRMYSIVGNSMFPSIMSKRHLAISSSYRLTFFFVLLQVDENRFFSLLKNSFDFQGRQQQLPASPPYIFHFSIYLVNGEPVVNLQVADAKLAIPFVIQDDSVGSGGCRSQSNDSATLLFCLPSKQKRKMGVSLQVL